MSETVTGLQATNEVSEDLPLVWVIHHYTSATLKGKVDLISGYGGIKLEFMADFFSFLNQALNLST